MKTSLQLAGQMLVYYAILVILSLMFVLGISVEMRWLQIAVSVLILLAYAWMLYADGATRGEKAATLSANIERQRSEGRAIEPAQQRASFRPATAWIGFLFGISPLILIALANILSAPFYAPDQLNPYEITARIVFSPYQPLYALQDGHIDLLNWLLLICPLILPLVMPFSYLQGPKLRQKKLEMIAKGVKRKRKNLKVNKKPRQPKPPKMQI